LGWVSAEFVTLTGDITNIPTIDVDTLATPEATEEATVEPTEEATEEATAEPTEEATAEATEEATVEATAVCSAAMTDESRTGWHAARARRPETRPTKISGWVLIRVENFWLVFICLHLLIILLVGDLRCGTAEMALVAAQ
jgi:hypothetical protein